MKYLRPFRAPLNFFGGSIFGTAVRSVADDISSSDGGGVGSGGGGVGGLGGGGGASGEGGGDSMFSCCTSDDNGSGGASLYSIAISLSSDSCSGSSRCSSVDSDSPVESDLMRWNSICEKDDVDATGVRSAARSSSAKFSFTHCSSRF